MYLRAKEYYENGIACLGANNVEKAYTYFQMARGEIESKNDTINSRYFDLRSDQVKVAEKLTEIELKVCINEEILKVLIYQLHNPDVDLKNNHSPTLEIIKKIKIELAHYSNSIKLAKTSYSIEKQWALDEQYASLQGPKPSAIQYRLTSMYKMVFEAFRKAYWNEALEKSEQLEKRLSKPIQNPTLVKRLFAEITTLYEKVIQYDDTNLKIPTQLADAQLDKLKSSLPSLEVTPQIANRMPLKNKLNSQRKIPKKTSSSASLSPAVATLPVLNNNNGKRKMEGENNAPIIVRPKKTKTVPTVSPLFQSNKNKRKIARVGVKSATEGAKKSKEFSNYNLNQILEDMNNLQKPVQLSKPF